ncbi:MAG TPA: GGDEF domain-containing protein [Planctomycetota bacterium]|nr:GGDEF domain-containing protein [Planctomycetota bacterium]
MDDVSGTTLVDASGNPDAESATSSRERPVLVVLDGPNRHQRFEIPPGETTLGRDTKCGIALSDTVCSRRHAKVTFMAGGSDLEHPQIVLTDAGSTNGTFVNGIRVDQTVLRQGDKIILGKTLLGFFLWDDVTLRSEEALLKNAMTDDLTGLGNRAAFNDALKREFNRVRCYPLTFSLILLDIDHFKQLNDAHGHPAGDQVLRTVASVIASSCRRVDFPCRYGGEEIVIVLPETPLQGALASANRLHESIRSLEVPCGAETLRVTASFGVAEVQPWMEAAQDLVKAADQALYRAKNAGRDRIEWEAGYSEDNVVTGRL